MAKKLTPEIRQEVGRAADHAWYEGIPFSRVVFHLPTAPPVAAPLTPCAAERGMKIFAADPDWDGYGD